MVIRGRMGGVRGGFVGTGEAHRALQQDQRHLRGFGRQLVHEAAVEVVPGDRTCESKAARRCAGPGFGPSIGLPPQQHGQAGGEEHERQRGEQQPRVLEKALLTSVGEGWRSELEYGTMVVEWFETALLAPQLHQLLTPPQLARVAPARRAGVRSLGRRRGFRLRRAVCGRRPERDGAVGGAEVCRWPCLARVPLELTRCPETEPARVRS